MSRHDPTLSPPQVPDLSGLTSQGLGRAAAGLLHEILHQQAPGSLALDDRRLVAGFVEALRSPGGPLQRLLPPDLAAIITFEAQSAALPGAYGRLGAGLAQSSDLDGPVWRADADLRARIGAPRAALLEFAHLAATHPGDLGPSAHQALRAAGWTADEGDLATRIVLLAALAPPRPVLHASGTLDAPGRLLLALWTAEPGRPFDLLIAPRPGPLALQGESFPDLAALLARHDASAPETQRLAQLLQARLAAVLTAREPRDLDLAIHALREGLLRLQSTLSAAPLPEEACLPRALLTLLLWQLLVIDAAFAAALTTGFAALTRQAAALLARPPASALTGAAAEALVAALRDNGAALAHPEDARIWQRAFRSAAGKDLPPAGARRKLHLLGGPGALG